MPKNVPRILITGSNGLLGSCLVPEMASNSFEIIASGRGSNRVLPQDLMNSGSVIYQPLDLLDGPFMQKLIIEMAPDKIIHAGACTQVDYCELHPVDCWNTNVTATQIIIEAAKKINASILYVSTDFVFSGEKGMYLETDDTSPVNYYGSSKLAAEKALMDSGLDWSIARTVLVYGNPRASFRTNILTWVRDELAAGKPIKVVNDQVRTPTFAPDLAVGIKLMIEKNAKGIYHLSGKDILTPYEMAIKTAEYLNLDKELITAVNADTFSQPAKRPLKTGFNIKKAESELGYAPVSFQDGLKKVFE